jgi:hypothetical protein
MRRCATVLAALVSFAPLAAQNVLLEPVQQITFEQPLGDFRLVERSSAANDDRCSELLLFVKDEVLALPLNVPADSNASPSSDVGGRLIPTRAPNVARVDRVADGVIPQQILSPRQAWPPSAADSQDVSNGPVARQSSRMIVPIMSHFNLHLYSSTCSAVSDDPQRVEGARDVRHLFPPEQTLAAAEVTGDPEHVPQLLAATTTAKALWMIDSFGRLWRSDGGTPTIVQTFKPTRVARSDEHGDAGVLVWQTETGVQVLTLGTVEKHRETLRPLSLPGPVPQRITSTSAGHWLIWPDRCAWVAADGRTSKVVTFDTLIRPTTFCATPSASTTPNHTAPTGQTSDEQTLYYGTLAGAVVSARFPSMERRFHVTPKGLDAQPWRRIELVNRPGQPLIRARRVAAILDLDAETGAQRGRFTCSGNASIAAVAATLDGTWLVLQSPDGAELIWRSPDWMREARFALHNVGRVRGIIARSSWLYVIADRAVSVFQTPNVASSH